MTPPHELNLFIAIEAVYAGEVHSKDADDGSRMILLVSRNRENGEQLPNLGLDANEALRLRKTLDDVIRTLIAQGWEPRD